MLECRCGGRLVSSGRFGHPDLVECEECSIEYETNGSTRRTRHELVEELVDQYDIGGEG